MTWCVRVGTLKVGLMNTDKYVLMYFNLLIVFGTERIASEMEGINYSINNFKRVIKPTMVLIEACHVCQLKTTFYPS